MEPVAANHPPMTVWDDDAQDPFEPRPAGRASSAGVDVAAKALVVVGVLGVLAWAWFAFRTQLQGSPFPGFGDSSEVSLAERLDLVASSFTQLVIPVGAIAAGRFLQHRP
jgi:hypothetical protein